MRLKVFNRKRSVISNRGKIVEIRLRGFVGVVAPSKCAPETLEELIERGDIVSAPYNRATSIDRRTVLHIAERLDHAPR